MPIKENYHKNLLANRKITMDYHNEITAENLVTLGFTKVRLTQYYSLRIGGDVVLWYNIIDGFIEVRRHIDRKRDSELKICLPKPYRTITDLREFIKVIT